MDFLTIIQILDSTVRLATPLLLACLAGLFSERAGIFDIGLEGKMLMAAFFSAAVAAVASINADVYEAAKVAYDTAISTGDQTAADVALESCKRSCNFFGYLDRWIPAVWMGLLAGIASSMLLSGLHGLASITFRGNQLISGVAINFLAAGMTVLIAQHWFQQGGRTPSLIGGGRFEPVTLPFADAIADTPFIGPIYAELISGHSILVYIAFLAVPATWWILYRTRFGLRLRAVGENPAAVDTAGVSVVGLRYAAVAICGILCGIAGAYLATALQAGFVKDMSAGRGFIALAALIFAKWRPWYALWACLLFGLFSAMETRPDVIQNLIGIKVQGQLLSALPYIMTVIILAGFVGKAIPPRAGGEPYVKER